MTDLRNRSALRVLIVLFMLVTSPLPALAQRGAALPTFKAIWEPVNYGEDLALTDVFFVSPSVGWVSGAGGTILHTKNGGASWTAQLGGDPQSREAPIEHLRFVDETHGWALQWAGSGTYKLLRTTDGESWEQAGSLPVSVALVDFAFSTRTNGVYVDGNDNVSSILHTTDGGRTWKEAFPRTACRTKGVVNGLTRQLDCTIKTMTMASPMVGYAFGGFGLTAPDLLLVLKTEDGGATWRMSTDAGVGPVFVYAWSQVAYFIDENTGMLGLNGKNIYATADGTQTWRGLPGSPGREFRFADPEVGWSFRGSTLTYTTDGGKRWASRDLVFPAPIRAFTLPRRDRAYVVGDHGLVYRYRIVAATDTIPKAIDAPLMPVFDTALDEQVAQIQKQMDALEAAIAAAQQRLSGSAAAGSTGADANVLDACCKEEIGQLELSVGAFTAEVPSFTNKYRNLNLVLAGIRLIGELFGESQGLNDSLAALKKARTAQAMSTALTDLSGHVDATATSIKALQEPQ